jgi:hypothetical protein
MHGKYRKLTKDAVMDLTMAFWKPLMGSVRSLPCTTGREVGSDMPAFMFNVHYLRYQQKSGTEFTDSYI